MVIMDFIHIHPIFHPIYRSASPAFSSPGPVNPPFPRRGRKGCGACQHPGDGGGTLHPGSLETHHRGLQFRDRTVKGVEKTVRCAEEAEKIIEYEGI